jgi:hypothetical protein
MNAGVSISPRGVSIRPRLAMPSVAIRVKDTCFMKDLLLLPKDRTGAAVAPFRKQAQA